MSGRDRFAARLNQLTRRAQTSATSLREGQPDASIFNTDVDWGASVAHNIRCGRLRCKFVPCGTLRDSITTDAYRCRWFARAHLHARSGAMGGRFPSACGWNESTCSREVGLDPPDLSCLSAEGELLACCDPCFSRRRLQGLGDRPQQHAGAQWDRCVRMADRIRHHLHSREVPCAEHRMQLEQRNQKA